MRKLFCLLCLLSPLGEVWADITLGLEQGFRQPPAAAKPQVWWHWMNGNVTREGITADLEAMAEVGIGGVTIFNLAGPYHKCDTPSGPARYLGPLWLDLVRFATTEADRLGLEVGMHNCGGWATTGGPWVPPELAMQQLVSREQWIEGGRQIEIELELSEVTLNHYRDIALFAIPADADTDYRLSKWQPKAGQRGSRDGRQPRLAPLPEGSSIPLDSIIEITAQLSECGKLKWAAPEGSWKLIRIGHTPTGAINKPAPPEATGLEIDKLRPEGVQLHWEKGIAPILAHLGDQVGTTFNRILIDSYEAGLHHWTPRMREEFTARRGYDPGPMLLALTGRVIANGPRTERFLWDFRRTIADLFAEHYYGQMGELCREHGMDFALEPYTSTFEGLQVGARGDLPMGEFWVNGNFRSTLRLASSIAHTQGLPVTAAEAFTAGPELGRWQNHPGVLKPTGDMAWGEGINRLVIHSYAHQPWLNLEPGMTMGQYGIHFGRTNTWWDPGAAWVDYLSRSQFLLQAGKPVADVLCYAGDAMPNKAVTLRRLTAAGYAYDSCGTEDLLSLEVKDGRFVLPSGQSYRLLILPNHGFHRPKLAHKLEALVAAGGHVLGPRPRYSPSLEAQPASNRAVEAIGNRVWGDCDGTQIQSHAFGKGRVYAGLQPEAVLERMQVQPAVCIPEHSGEISWVHREAAGRHWFYIANLSEEPVLGDWGFRVPPGLLAESFDAEQGRIQPLVVREYRDGRRWLPLRLDPGKSNFVVFRKEGAAEPLSCKAGEMAEWLYLDSGQPGLRVWQNGAHEIQDVSGKSIRLMVDDLPEPKALNGNWEITFEGRQGRPDKLIRTEDLFAWNRREDPEIRYFSGTAGYRYEFTLPEGRLKDSMECWLDLGAMEVIAELTVNGHAAGTVWHQPYRKEISQLLRPGNNRLEIKVTNLWINRLIGDSKLPKDFDWEDKAVKAWPEWLLDGTERASARTTFTTWNHWQAEDPLRPSGLIGPVRLEFARLLEID